MAATARTLSRPTEELLFQNDSAFLCLIVNRRARSMRIIDFRTGMSASKRAFVLSVARREGLERLFMLTERDEVGAWLRAGFVREGNVPGYYKRNDAVVLGCWLAPGREGRPSHRLRLVGQEASTVAERTVQATRRLGHRQWAKVGAVRLQQVDGSELAPAMQRATQTQRALTAFDPFGHDAERSFYLVSTRSRPPLVLSAETQICFGHALIETLASPETDEQRTMLREGIARLCSHLTESGLSCAFAITPIEDVALASVYMANGFRKTAVLQRHLLIGNRTRTDALLWTRKWNLPEERARKNVEFEL